MFDLLIESFIEESKFQELVFSLILNFDTWTNENAFSLLSVPVGT